MGQWAKSASQVANTSSFDRCIQNNGDRMGRRFILDLRKTVQRITSVFIRLGTCPTGIFATTFKVFMSMATTELNVELPT